MDDDFNTVEAVAILFELAHEANKQQSAQLAGELKALAAVLGLLERDATQFFLQAGTNAGEGELTAAAIDDLIAQRKAARAAKNFAESDRIRDVLTAAGVVLEDSAAGTTWRRA